MTTPIPPTTVKAVATVLRVVMSYNTNVPGSIRLRAEVLPRDQWLPIATCFLSRLRDRGVTFVDDAADAGLVTPEGAQEAMATLGRWASEQGVTSDVREALAVIEGRVRAVSRLRVVPDQP